MLIFNGLVVNDKNWIVRWEKLIIKKPLVISDILEKLGDKMIISHW